MIQATHQQLALLASAADGCGRREEAKALRDAGNLSPQRLHDLLTRIERTSGLEPEMWTAVVLLKACLAGKPKEEEFRLACLRAQGLV